MRKVSGAVLIVLLAAPLAAAGQRYLYQAGRYHPARIGFFGHPAYRTGYRLYSGYSPSFTLGVYRPAAYANLGRCDWTAREATVRGASGSYPVVLSLPVDSEIVRANFSDLIFNVTPARAMVYIDGSLIGSAGSFATDRDRFPILAGEHTLLIKFHGFMDFEATLDVVPNRTLRIDVQLEPANSDARE